MERNAIHYTPRYFSCGMYFRFLPKPTRILSNFPSILELDSFSCPAREPWKLGALAGRPDLFSRKKNFSINHDRPGRSVFLNIFTTEISFQRKLSRVLQPIPFSKWPVWPARSGFREAPSLLASSSIWGEWSETRAPRTHCSRVTPPKWTAYSQDSKHPKLQQNIDIG